MSERYIIATRAECETVQARVSKLLGYPRKGRHIGGGRHVNLNGRERHGWTLQAYAIEVELDKSGEVASDGRIFTRVVDPDADGEKANLTATELGYLRAKWAEGEDKPVAVAERAIEP